MAMTLRKRIPEFASPADEQAYRDYSRAETITNGRRVIIAGSAIELLLIANDFLLVKSTGILIFCIALRLSVMALTLGLLPGFKRSPSNRWIDSAIFSWMSLALFSMVAIAATRPAGFFLHVLVNQAVLFAAYLLVPLRYQHRLICGVGGAAGYLAVLAANHTAAEMTPFVVAMVVVNVVGGLAAFHLERLRRLEYVHLTELRAAKQAADEASLAKSRFLAAASHDLRQPVHALGLFVEALRERTMDQDARPMLEYMHDSVAAMNELFTALLDISRLDAGVIEPQLKSFAIRPLLERIQREFHAEAQSKGLRLVAHPCSLAVHSDPVLLGRILRNVVSNAVRYSDTGRVVIGCRRKLGRLSVQVWDTGQGFGPEHEERIYEEFYQIDNAARDRTQGLRLGLSIVKRLANLLDHPFQLRSQAGKGSVFAIEVPLAETVPTAPVLQLGRAPHLRMQGLALVVDDEIAIQNAMQSLLRGWGLDVVVAGSCQEILDRLDPGAMTPDLIICDYRLRGGENGIDVIRRLQAEFGRDIPGMLITGDTAPDRLRDAQASGLVLLHKPVSNSKLRATVGNLMRARTSVAITD